MTKYSISNLRLHWTAKVREFEREYEVCIELFREIAEVGSLVVEALAQHRNLEANCAFLLVTKALNHSFSTMLLIERGLIVDAALTSRNAIETLLLLELLAKRPVLCQKWAGGHEFKPADVRRQLSELPRVVVQNLAIEVSPDEYDDVRFAYSWLSRITHANLESLHHSASEEIDASTENSYALHIGGAHSPTAAAAITAALGSAFDRAMLTAIVTHAQDKLEPNLDAFKRLEHRLSVIIGKKST